MSSLPDPTAPLARNRRPPGPRGYPLVLPFPSITLRPDRPLLMRDVARKPSLPLAQDPASPRTRADGRRSPTSRLLSPCARRGSESGRGR